MEVACVFCTRSFTHPKRLPYCLPCGHSLCLECLNNQNGLQCPEDGISIASSSTLPLNHVLANTLKKMCVEHNKEISVVCMDDRSLICSHCALFGCHKNHEIKNLADIEFEIQTRTDSLINAIGILECSEEKLDRVLLPHLKTVFQAFLVKRNSLEGELTDSFNEIRNKIDLLEKECLKRLDGSFEYIEESFSIYQNICKDVKKQTDDWKHKAKELVDNFEDESIEFSLLSNNVFEDAENLFANIQKAQEINTDAIEELIDELSLEFNTDFLGDLCKVKPIRLEGKLQEYITGLSADFSLAGNLRTHEIDLEKTLRSYTDLKDVTFFNNNLTESGVASLFSSLEYHNSLESLKCSHISFAGKAVSSLIKLLNTNGSIKQFVCTGNPLMDESLKLKIKKSCPDVIDIQIS